VQSREYPNPYQQESDGTSAFGCGKPKGWPLCWVLKRSEHPLVLFKAPQCGAFLFFVKRFTQICAHSALGLEVAIPLKDQTELK
jgi:hypothetical protein